jgi:hypothetical protein
MAAAAEARSAARPMADGRADARPMPDPRADGVAHPEARRAETPRAQPAQRTAADRHATLSDADVEDAVVVTRERRAESPQRTDKPQGTAAAARSEPLAALFGADTAHDFRSRWDATQIGFVDDPRRAVQQADELVAEVMKSLAQTFANERQQLEAQMNSDSASTENLRVALQRYRSFFQRLLSL